MSSLWTLITVETKLKYALDIKAYTVLSYVMQIRSKSKVSHITHLHMPLYKSLQWKWSFIMQLRKTIVTIIYSCISSPLAIVSITKWSPLPPKISLHITKHNICLDRYGRWVLCTWNYMMTNICQNPITSWSSQQWNRILTTSVNGFLLMWAKLKHLPKHIQTSQTLNN